MSEDDKTVPLDQLIKERDKARVADEAKKTAEAERDDFKTRLEALEQKDKTDVEKLTKQVTDLEKANGDLTTSNAKLTSETENTVKRQLITDAAGEANFRKPGYAARLMDTETFKAIDSKDAAQAAVKSLADADTELLAAPPKASTAPDLVQKVLDRGKALPGSTDGDEEQPDLSPTEQAAAAYAAPAASSSS